jgi:hypothetical protein
MTREGFKPVMVRQGAYDQASKQAKVEETSITEIVTKAIQRYVNQRLEMEETIKTIYKIYEDAQRKPPTLTSPQIRP